MAMVIASGSFPSRLELSTLPALLTDVLGDVAVEEALKGQLIVFLPRLNVASAIITHMLKSCLPLHYKAP